jgi:hypothetical protein
VVEDGGNPGLPPYCGYMVAWSVVTRQHVLAAIHEYDEVGQDEFLGRYGFAPTQAGVLRHANHSYDSEALLGASLRYATGTAATSDAFSGSKTAAAKVLRNLDFDILSPEKAESAEVVPTTSIPNQRRTNGIEPVVATCPRCFLALTAAGACDNCD